MKRLRMEGGGSFYATDEELKNIRLAAEQEQWDYCENTGYCFNSEPRPEKYEDIEDYYDPI